MRIKRCKWCRHIRFTFPNTGRKVWLCMSCWTTPIGELTGYRPRVNDPVFFKFKPKDRIKHTRFGRP